MNKKSNVTIVSNVKATKAVGSQITEEDKKKIHGAVLAQMEPAQFDKRVLSAGHSLVKKKQRRQYLEDLPCSICGVKGGNCGCDG